MSKGVTAHPDTACSVNKLDKGMSGIGCRRVPPLNKVKEQSATGFRAEAHLHAGMACGVTLVSAWGGSRKQKES